MSPDKGNQSFLRGASPGISYLEFAIVTPVVLLIIFGMVEVGRLLSNQIWFSRAATQVATMGSITGIDQRDSTMLRFANDLFGSSGAALAEVAADVGTDPQANFVRAEFTGRVSPLFQAAGLPIRARAEMAVLLTRESPLGNLTWSQNPPQFYNCNGQPLRVGGSPCKDVSCARTSCP
jgi:Flp pilus assembly protein TadG